MEQLDYNLLFRWFVGLRSDDAGWSPTTFSKNRDRLLNGERRDGVLRRRADPRGHGALLSDEHLTVDGTHPRAPDLARTNAPEAGSPEPKAAGRRVTVSAAC